jgi:hypothetical protein
MLANTGRSTRKGQGNWRESPLDDTHAGALRHRERECPPRAREAGGGRAESDTLRSLVRTFAKLSWVWLL